MPLIDFRQARREVRLGVVLELLRWQPRERTDQQVRGACPLHGATSPASRSFSAHLGRGVWQCFVCGASGNALDLWARATGQRVYAAVRDLYDRLGQPVPWLREQPARANGDKTDAIDRSRAKTGRVGEPAVRTEAAWDERTARTTTVGPPGA